MIAQCTIQVKHQFPFSIIEWETIFKDFEKVCFPIINAFKNNSIFNFYFTFKQYASLYWMVKCFSFLFLILTYMQGNFDCLVSQWFHSLLINQPDLLIPLKQGHNEICHIADVMSTSALQFLRCKMNWAFMYIYLQYIKAMLKTNYLYIKRTVPRSTNARRTRQENTPRVRRAFVESTNARRTRGVFKQTH